ncbi:hypothetical protein [Kordia sp.]|uniref:hypothetical protein n=1 Tax=Kordia sp. TaxID=1965332 RepID=UPI003D2DEB22
MKNITSKGYASIRGILSSVKTPKFSVKTVFLVLVILLVGFRLLHGYKVYCLVNEWCDVFTLLVHVDITNIIGFGDIITVVHDSKTNVFNYNRLTYRVLLQFCKKFPSLLLFSFVLLVAAAFAAVPDFDVWYFMLVAGQDYLIHKVSHFMVNDRSNNWYTCIKYINKCKRYIKKKVNSPNATSHEKE